MCYLYKYIISNEETCANYFQKRNLETVEQHNTPTVFW